MLPHEYQAHDQLVSDGRIKHSELNKVKELGTITIECEHFHQRGLIQNGRQGRAEGVGIVSEKAMKGRAISHSVE